MNLGLIIGCYKNQPGIDVFTIYGIPIFYVKNMHFELYSIHDRMLPPTGCVVIRHTLLCILHNAYISSTSDTLTI